MPLNLRLETLAVFAACAFTLGCGSARDCVPGVVQACACRAHASGLQTCDATGTGFSTCACICDEGSVTDATGQCVPRVCTPNSVGACATCGLGATSQRTCAADALSWSACQCSCPSGFTSTAQAACQPDCTPGTRWQTSTSTCVAATFGDIGFRWTFGGSTCAQANISQVQVEVSSRSGPEILAQGGLYACSASGTEGIQLLSFTGGDYVWRLSGLDASGVQQYAATGSTTVHGDVTVSVQLVH